jgi:uncharacterized membrane protein
MNIRPTLITITASALAGMVMGGLFGLASGSITPDFFGHLIPWQDVKPQGFATFLGATVGVVLGGVMGCFAILVNLVIHCRKDSDPKP